MKKTNVRALCEGAILVAMAQILGYIKLWRMPWGGSVVLAMVPLVLFSVRWGLGKGLLAGLAFGILQFVFDGGFALGWQSIIGDYILSYFVVGLAGLMAGKKGAAYWGSLLGGGARFLVHYVVGATVWGEYMPEEFLGMAMTSPWIYSLIYNLCYMVPNILVTVAVFALLYATHMKKYLKGEDLT